MKDSLLLVLGCIAYWIIGWALAGFNGGNKFCGDQNWASHGMEDSNFSLFFFHFVFAATAATIISGAMAERCEFSAYIAYSMIVTGQHKYTVRLVLCHIHDISPLTSTITVFMDAHASHCMCGNLNFKPNLKRNL